MTKTYSLPCFRVELVRERLVKVQTEGVVRGVEDVIQVARSIADKDREHLMVIWLNARHKMIGHEIVSIGCLTASLAHPREIFKGAIVAGSAAVILVHNHPSGECEPSDDDRRLTKRISQAGTILGIDVIDHLIVSETSAYSFSKQGGLQ